MYYQSKFYLPKYEEGARMAAGFPHENLELELEKVAQRIPPPAKVGVPRCLLHCPSRPPPSWCRSLCYQKNDSFLLVIFCWLNDLNKLPQWAAQYLEEEERDAIFLSGKSH